MLLTESRFEYDFAIRAYVDGARNVVVLLDGNVNHHMRVSRQLAQVGQVFAFESNPVEGD